MRLADAVLFDFAGTLAVPLSAGEQLALLGLPGDAAALERAGLPGGPYPVSIPAAAAAAYAARDTDAAAHRLAYETLAAPVVGAGAAPALYDLNAEARGWVAYPDALPALDALRASGIPVGVITNVGFDLLPVARGTGILERVDSWTSSLDVGAAKPDAAIFAAAATALGVAPARCLMVGDNPHADVGGVTLGMPTLVLPMSPPRAPHGLAAVLALLTA